MEDNVSYVQGLAQPVVIIHHPQVSTASVRFRGTYRPTCICSQYLVSLGLAWAERGMGASYIKYTWSIGGCAIWCNRPVPCPAGH